MSKIFFLYGTSVFKYSMVEVLFCCFHYEGLKEDRITEKDSSSCIFLKFSGLCSDSIDCATVFVHRYIERHGAGGV